MSQVQIRNRQNFAGGLGLTLEAFIEQIKAKNPATRNKLERDILALYERANVKGEQLCIEGFKEKLRELYQNNKILLLISGIVIAAFLAKRYAGKL